MTDVAYLKYRDFSRETSTMRLNTANMTAANLAAQQTALTTLAAAADTITTGIQAERGIQVDVQGSSTPPASEEAQIEKRWLILYNDTQQYLDPPTDSVLNPGFGKLFQTEWPCADPTDHLQTNSDLADLTETDVAAFVTAFEAYVRSPYGGAVNVLEMRFVGSMS